MKLFLILGLALTLVSCQNKCSARKDSPVTTNPPAEETPAEPKV